MKCPACDAAMRVGTASVERSTFGVVMDVVDAFTGGMTSMPHYLYFREEGGGEPACVDHSRKAYFCPECEALVIVGTRSSRESRVVTEPPPQPRDELPRTTCPACWAAITPEHQRCPDCEIALR